MPNDVLYNCAVAYKKIMDYELTFVLKNDMKVVTLQLSDKDFMHLTSLEKLDDLSELTDISSQNLLDMILNKELTYARIKESVHFDELKYIGNSPLNIETITDRLIALISLYDYLDKVTLENTTIHKWLRDVNPNDRPYRSKINADYLIQFHDSVSKKSQDERTCAFFISSKADSKINYGVSIFPTDKPFDRDERKLSVQYEILSAESLCISTGIKKQLISALPEQIQSAQNIANQKDQNRTISNDIKSLKNKRNKVIENPSVGNQNKYNKQLAIFKNRNIYTADMVKEAINRLNDQLSAAPNDKAADMIKEEIKFLQDDLIDRQQNPPQQIKGLSISTVQMNDDSTLSVNNIATLHVPKAITEVPKAVQRKTYTITGTIKSFLSDVSDSIRKIFTPEQPKKPHRASQSKSKGVNPSQRLKTLKCLVLLLL